MNSPDPAPAPFGLRDEEMYACSAVVFAALIAFFCAVYSWLGLGVMSGRIALYTIFFGAACAGVVFWLARVRKLRRLALIAAALLALEAVLAAKFIVMDRRHHVESARLNQVASAARAADMHGYAFHPLLGIVGKPNFSAGRITHTAEGWRTTTQTSGDGPTLAVLGGSTTYSFELRDDETWASRLAGLTGFRVTNLGFIGYATSDHVVQTAFMLPQLQPDCALYYVGWNDVQSTNLRPLTPDYADFHVRMQYRNLTSVPTEFVLAPYTPFENAASVMQLVNSFRLSLRARLAELRADVFEPRGSGELTSEPDPLALSFYLQNLRTIARLNAHAGITTVFVPQILNRPAWNSDQPYDWIPNVARKDVPGIVDAYNRALVGMRGQDGVHVIDSVLRVDWRPEHFADEGHLSAAGSQLFADTIADDVTRICRSR